VPQLLTRRAVLSAGKRPPTHPHLPLPFRPLAGALAGFAAATEFTFGSIVQRVMTWPGSVRFHYGHPDLWNKLFIMTRGGVSKATR
jgi:hypothetical protein